MKTIGYLKFPETPDEAATWKPHITYLPLHSRVLFVAKTRIEGEWACYCTPVPGMSHEEEKHLWQFDGVKVQESIARATFPQFVEIPYSE